VNTPRPFLLAGRLATGEAQWRITNPFDGSEVGLVSVASRVQMEEAVSRAADAADEARRLPAHARAEVLLRIRSALQERKDELIRTMAAEAGKPVTAARAEVERLFHTLRDGAEEARRIPAELLPLDAVPAGAGRLGLVRRFPLSVVSGIVPFNFPLNLLAHKLAPAIACGASIVIKPPPQDPITPLMLAEAVAGAGYPDGAISILPCEVEDAAPMLDDARVRMISFTGSAKVGWAIRERAAKKRVVLELGGNAAMIVAADADVERAASRAAIGGYAYAGQSCISVQRILVHRSLLDRFVDRFVERVRALRVGDPLDEHTDVGPVIDEASARRAATWVKEAVAGGARAVLGGGRTGTLMEPTVLLDTTREMKVNAEEVFAPVTTVRPFDSLPDALGEANATRYGLQAGLFTNDLRSVLAAWDGLDVGGIIVNDIPSWRVDQMPYGGVKDSGQGREGVRYAIEEMTEPRLLVIGPSEPDA
jgi:glyceraldehyde-3-phosphate dehydrogenase (NADP+)